jgi:hypothetical protein
MRHNSFGSFHALRPAASGDPLCRFAGHITMVIFSGSAGRSCQGLVAAVAPCLDLNGGPANGAPKANPRGTALIFAAVVVTIASAGRP